MKRKTPKIDWEAKTETVDDIQYSYIAKAVTYARDCNVCLFVGRKTAEPAPLKFTYYLELDIAPEKDMSIWFRKRGQDIAGFSFRLDPQDWKAGILVLPWSNLITFPKSNHTLNLFETHIKSDAVVFGYTSLEGKQKEFRFPLTGFNEKYLEQFT